MTKQNIKTICIFGDDGILLTNGQFHLVCWMGTHAAAIDWQIWDEKWIHSKKNSERKFEFLHVVYLPFFIFVLFCLFHLFFVSYFVVEAKWNSDAMCLLNYKLIQEALIDLVSAFD